MATPPEMIVVGGPNGAGKTTFAEHFITEYHYLYLGADAKAAQISPEDPAAAAIQAGREFRHELREKIAARVDLVVESTLSGRTFQWAFNSARSAGYEVTLLFLWLDSTETCIGRVRQRVQLGGHHVPDTDVERRFRRSLRNFWDFYRPLADQWILAYNAESEIKDVAGGQGDDFTIQEKLLFIRFQNLIAETK